jgi:hypothetical protein
MNKTKVINGTAPQIMIWAWFLRLYWVSALVGIAYFGHQLYTMQKDEPKKYEYIVGLAFAILGLVISAYAEFLVR